MWSDNETLEDFLSCHHLVETVESLVTNEQLLPCSVGVFGDWGSGKTSLLRMIESRLTNREDVVVIWFNGWLFEGLEDAKTALMGTILEKLAEKKPITEKGLGLLCNLWKRVDKMRTTLFLSKLGIATTGGVLSAAGHGGHEMVTAGAVAGALTDATEIAKQIKDACGDKVKPEDIEKCLKETKDTGSRKAIREFREDFGKLLQSVDGVASIVVFIDDLDRCMPETIVETLEAIKLFLFVPKTAFVIGADERLVKYAVRKRFPELPGEKVEVGRDYLEKLIQFPVRVPSLGVGEFETYINLLFAKLGWINAEQFSTLRASATEVQGDGILDTRLNLMSAKKALGDQLPASLEETFVLASHLAPILSIGLAGNPRQCKRFLNMLLMRRAMAKTRSIELSQRVLAKLMLLEYFRPESFRQLAHFQAQESGKPIALARAEKTVKAKKHSSDKSAAEIADEGTEEAAPLIQRVPPWLDDDWIEKWLDMEPHLASEDLRPYFFFSRDTLGSLSAVAQRMTPLAQEVLTGLLHDSEAVNKTSLQKAATLNDAEAAAIFEAFCERVRQEDDLGDEKSSFARLLTFVKAREGLFSQYIAHLSDLSEAVLPPQVVTSVISLADNTVKQSVAKPLLLKWTQSTNAKLKKLAKARVDKLTW